MVPTKRQQRGQQQGWFDQARYESRLDYMVILTRDTITINTSGEEP